MHRRLRRLTVAAFALLVACAAFGQAQQGTPEFEVISVKPMAKNGPPIFRRQCAGDRFVSVGMPLSFLIRWAYQLSAPQIQGLPEWANDRESAYDVEAKASAPMSDAQCKAMVQSLLASRFKMAARHEQREVRVYALTVGGKGTKMREATSDAKSVVIINGAPFRTGSEVEPVKGLSMARLATYLSGVPAVGLPVVDRTGLAGTYAFNLSFSIREGDDLPTIWTAVQEQLGLKLVPATAPVDVLVVDHIEKAGPN